jgi:Glycosyltransferases involved in cell wall biogenesis
MAELKENNFVSVVVYLHNGANRVESLLRGINKIFSENFKKYEIIFVNDASVDAGVSIIKKVAADMEGPMVSVLNMSYYQGVEQAMNAGVDLAIGDFVFEFDNTVLDFDLDLIMDVYRRSLTGYDIVIASPEGRVRETSKWFYLVYNSFSKTAYPLKTESFKVLSRRVINRVGAMSSTIPYRKALYSNCGLKQDTIYYKPIQGRSDLARNELQMRKDVALNSLILFTDVAYKVTFGMALAMMILAVAIGIYAVAIFLGETPVAGWTTTMLFLSVSFFGVFAILAIIIKYLTVLMNLVFQRQNYVVESLEKITR